MLKKGLLITNLGQFFDELKIAPNRGKTMITSIHKNLFKTLNL